MHRSKRLSWIGAATFVAALLIGGCGDGDDESGMTSSVGQPDDLVGRTFVSTADWSGEGSSFSTPVTVTFDDEGGITWRAECNTAATDVRITPDHLEIGQVASTAMGCAKQAMDQDDELSDFFAADPAWSLDGNRLTLSSDQGSIEVDLQADGN
ncbi:MAG: META domain-containing protein [Solirubrobacterales bacterium]